MTYKHIKHRYGRDYCSLCIFIKYTYSKQVYSIKKAMLICYFEGCPNRIILYDSGALYQSK